MSALVDEHACSSCEAFEAAERAAIQGSMALPPHDLNGCMCAPFTRSGAEELFVTRRSVGAARRVPRRESDRGLTETDEFDFTIMLPRWILQSSFKDGLGAGAALVFGAILGMARGSGVGPSRTIATPSQIALRVGLSASCVRRCLHRLEDEGLIARDGRDGVLFRRHPLMGAAPIPSYDGLLDVQGAWSNDAFFLPRTIASEPTEHVSPAEKVFWAVLHRYGKREWGYIAAKQETLATEIGISSRQVQKYIRQLETLGLLLVEDRRAHRKPNKMQTRVGAPLLGRTRAEARHELNSRRTRAATRRGGE